MALGIGWALLDARIGENRPHAHIAHQISLAVDDDIVVAAKTLVQVRCGQAVVIPAQLRHHIGPLGARIRSIYVDPLFAGATHHLRSSGVSRLPLRLARALTALETAAEANHWVFQLLERSPARAIDSRLREVLTRHSAPSSPAELATQLRLSASRLRDIVVRDFGVPPAKLLQWLKLQRALAAFAPSSSIAEAAVAGGFSDQADFTRRLVQWFGVTPGKALANLSIELVR